MDNLSAHITFFNLVMSRVLRTHCMTHSLPLVVTEISTIVNSKKAGTCGRSMKHHLRCQISIYVEFSFNDGTNIAYDLESIYIEFVLYHFILVQITDLTYDHFLCPAHKCQLVLVNLY